MKSHNSEVNFDVTEMFKIDEEICEQCFKTNAFTKKWLTCNTCNLRYLLRRDKC